MISAWVASVTGCGARKRDRSRDETLAKRHASSVRVGIGSDSNAAQAAVRVSEYQAGSELSLFKGRTSRPATVSSVVILFSKTAVLMGCTRLTNRTFHL